METLKLRMSAAQFIKAGDEFHNSGSIMLYPSVSGVLTLISEDGLVMTVPCSDPVKLQTDATAYSFSKPCAIVAELPTLVTAKEALTNESKRPAMSAIEQAVFASLRRMKLMERDKERQREAERKAKEPKPKPDPKPDDGPLLDPVPTPDPEAKPDPETKKEKAE